LNKKPFSGIPTPQTKEYPKSMTLIAAFRFQDGVLVCADREESDAVSKRSVDKIEMLVLSDIQ
jgi:20S proteasome alpha/beta subunit